MSERFAFELDGTSIAFCFIRGLGDAVVARKVFDAIVEFAPDCHVDIFCLEKFHTVFAKAFYSDSKNLNIISDSRELYQKYSKSYDLSLWVLGTHAVTIENVNDQRLQTLAPKLFVAVKKIENYNQENVYQFQPWTYSLPLRNVMISRILNVNFNWFLSCGGALNIREVDTWLKPLPEYKNDFDNLRLSHYITIYSNMPRDENLYKVKAWPIRYLVEYVDLIKKFLPMLEVVQVGGGYDREIKNVDKKFLGCDLELTKHILANSLLHVGCEGGLVHLASALGTKCLVFFGMNDWHYFGYPQNINIASTECAPCLYVDKNFGCMRGFLETPCMLNITPQEAFRETCEYLKTLGEK